MLGQLRLMDCSVQISPPLRVLHTWVADGTGKTWCSWCGVVRHPDFEKRDAAKEERLHWLRAKHG